MNNSVQTGPVLRFHDFQVNLQTGELRNDGIRLKLRKPQPVTELILVQNWFEELRRLAPTTKK